MTLLAAIAAADLVVVARRKLRETIYTRPLTWEGMHMEVSYGTDRRDAVPLPD